MSLRIAFIGCVESSRVALQSLLGLPAGFGHVVGVISRRSSVANSDFVNLQPLSSAHEIETLMIEDVPQEEQQALWLESLQPDVVFCVGWSRLLSKRILDVPRHGVIGFHPAALPANRGRHPLIWALVLGLEETASSFFFMQATADSGPLADQHRFAISTDDDADTLYKKILIVIPEQIVKIVRGLVDGTLIPVHQDHIRANHWRKRSALDGQIDWRMPAQGIRNLVRALVRPYPGAHFVHQGAPVKLWRCEVVESAPRNAEPGKVLEVTDRHVTIKCGDHALRLLDHEFVDIPSPGTYIS